MPTFLLFWRPQLDRLWNLPQPIPPTATTIKASAANIPCNFLRRPRGRISNPASAVPDGIAHRPVFFNSLELKPLVSITNVAVPGLVPSSVIFAGSELATDCRWQIGTSYVDHLRKAANWNQVHERGAGISILDCQRRGQRLNKIVRHCLRHGTSHRTDSKYRRRHSSQKYCSCPQAEPS